MKAGTRIELHGTPDFGVEPELAIISRWRTAISGPKVEGWYIVKFNDGATLCIHQSRFRVIGNR